MTFISLQISLCILSKTEKEGDCVNNKAKARFFIIENLEYSE